MFWPVLETATGCARHVAWPARLLATLVDAPVMGDRASIEQGVLTILIGGALTDAAQQAVLGQLARYSDRQLLVGGLGAGTAAKLSLNML